MILTCPECATSYFVDDARVPAAGRSVKCSNCGAKWIALPEGAASPEPAPAPRPQAPAAQAPPADDIVVEGPAPEPEAAAPTVPKRRTPAPPRAEGKVMVWAIAAGLSVALVAGVLVFRGPIVRLWPASGVAYRSLGVPVNDLGLVIEAVKAEPAFQGGRPVLSVTGQVRSIRDSAATAPALRVSLLDLKGRPLVAKVAQPINGQVPGRAVRHFAIAIVDPPANVKDLEVIFEPGGRSAAPPPRAAAAVVSGPGPIEEAKPLPPGSPDALPPPHD
jgi:predicted Zn finger-like uncharacterized protein